MATHPSQCYYFKYTILYEKEKEILIVCVEVWNYLFFVYVCEFPLIIFVHVLVFYYYVYEQNTGAMHV